MKNLLLGIIIGAIVVAAVAASPFTAHNAITPITTAVLQASPPDGYTENLTDQQRLSLDAWMREFRGACGSLARCMDNDLEPITTDYAGSISTILDELHNDDVIPVQGGLDGAEPMTKDQVVTIVSYMQNVQTYNSSAHRQNLARACGESNID